jgi:hypothetical protein
MGSLSLLWRCGLNSRKVIRGLALTPHLHAIRALVLKCFLGAIPFAIMCNTAGAPRQS